MTLYSMAAIRHSLHNAHTLMFNGHIFHISFQDNLVGRYQKDKPFWILLKQEMMGWQWHQLNHMQIICTSLQSRQITTPAPHHSIFFTGRMPFLLPNQQRQSIAQCTWPLYRWAAIATVISIYLSLNVNLTSNLIPVVATL